MSWIEENGDDYYLDNYLNNETDSIQVGEYVRTKEGYIGKLIQIIPNVLNYYVIDTKIKVRNDGMPETYLYLRDGYGFKHSFNIIDLIEVGDYVNGHKISEFKIETNNYGYKYLVFYDFDRKCAIFERDIKSIVTKERFKESEYKVNE